MELFSLNAIKSAHWALNIALFSLFVTALLHLLLAKSEKSAVEEQDKKGTFPVFKDAEVIRAYWNYKATYKSLGILSFFRLIIYLAFMHSAINLISEHDGSPYFLSCSVALVLIKIGFLFYVLAAAGVAIIGWRDPSGANEQLQCWKSFLVTRLLGGKLEEISVIAMFIWLGLILYARVDASAYPHPPAGSMTCDPSNVSRSLPVDHVLFNAFLVVTSPLGLRGMRFEVAILLWVISVGFLIASMVRVGGNFDWMTASIYVIPLTLLFEHERFMRLSFQSIQLAEQRSEALVKVGSGLLLLFTDSVNGPQNLLTYHNIRVPNPYTWPILSL